MQESLSHCRVRRLTDSTLFLILLLTVSSFQKPFAEAMLGTPNQLHLVTDRQTVNAHGQYKPCQPLGDQYFLAIAATKAGGVPQL